MTERAQDLKKGRIAEQYVVPTLDGEIVLPSVPKPSETIYPDGRSEGHTEIARMFVQVAESVRSGMTGAEAHSIAMQELLGRLSNNKTALTDLMKNGRTNE